MRSGGKFLNWAGGVLLRLALYVVAVVLLGVAASKHVYPLIILGAAVVAVAAVLVHRELANRRRHGESSNDSVGARLALLVLVTEIGVVILALSHFQIFTLGGFVGVSFVSFGFGQLIAEMREASWLNGTIAAFSAANAVGLSIVFGASGAGGVPMLVLAVVFTYPAISFGAQVAVDWTTATKKRDGKPTGEAAGVTEWFDQHWWQIGVVLLVVAAVGLLWLNSIGGFVFVLVLGAVVFLLVGAISSNTDADWLFALIAIAIVLSQSPLKDPPRQFTDGPDQHEIVVFGDSYISGEGANRFFAGTNTTNPETFDKCRRARTAWAPRVAKQRGLELDFFACSGANWYNVFGHGQYIGENPKILRASVGGELPHYLSQFELYNRKHRKAKVDWAFISIGGNDGGFGDLVHACIAPGDCTEIGQQFLDLLDELPGLLKPVYERLRKHFDGRVVVVPYVVPLREEGCGIFSSTFTQREQRFLHRFTIELDATIERQASSSGVFFVKDMPNALVADHLRICDASAGDNGVNVFALNPVEGRIDPREWVHNSMHPKDTGHTAMARVINDWIEHSANATPEPANVLPAPKRDMQLLMGAPVKAAAEKETPHEWVAAATHTAFWNRLPGLALLIVSVFGLWVLILRALRLRTIRRPLSYYIHSPELWTRVASLAVLLVVAVLALGLFGRLSGFPSGYNDAQSTVACSLPKDVDALRDLRHGAMRDLLVFIPLYVVLAFGVVVVTTRKKPRQLVFSDALAGVAVLMLGLADLIETLRFRHALSRLLANAACESLKSYTEVTAKFTCIKLALFGVVLILVVTRVLVPLKESERKPD